MAISIKTIENIENSIQAANFRLYQLKRVYGENSQIYSYYKKEVEKTFKNYDLENMIQYSEKTGAIKIDKKRAAYEIAHFRTNERNILSKFVRSIPTTSEIKARTAKELEIPIPEVTKAEQEAVWAAQTDFKNALAAFYAMAEGSSYRQILIPELYKEGGNDGDLSKSERQKIMDLISFYSRKGTSFLNSANVDELEELREETRREIKQ